MRFNCGLRPSVPVYLIVINLQNACKSKDTMTAKGSMWLPQDLSDDRSKIHRNPSNMDQLTASFIYWTELSAVYL